MTVLSILNNQDNWLPNEIDVYQDLIDETIQGTGSDLRYMPKDQINLDELFGESTISEFKAGFVIEMRLERISNFNGDEDLYSSFGIQHTDQATLVVSIRRFAVEGKSFGLVQPVEEDLIYMPWSNTIWKIRKVKHDEDYFQFGQNRVWRIEVGLYDPSHETFQGGTVAPTDIRESLQPVDDQGLMSILGIDSPNKQDESSVFAREVEEIIPSTFNSNDPFGGA